MNEAFGMMDQAYFISKNEILGWINTTYKLHLNKIEELGSGAVYCQILDSMQPGKVSFSKVNWKAKTEYDFIQNLKLLQQGFIKMGVQKHLEVEKLSKCKYQDNLEMIQWLKRFYDSNGGSEPNYDPEERRKQKIDLSFAEKIVKPKMYNGQGQVIQSNPDLQQKKESFGNIQIQKQESKNSSKDYPPVNIPLPNKKVAQNIQKQSSPKTVPIKTSTETKFFQLKTEGNELVKIDKLTDLKQQLRINKYREQYEQKQQQLDQVKDILLMLGVDDSQKILRINKIFGISSIEYKQSDSLEENDQQQEYQSHMFEEQKTQ